jgi:hypothetical protein
MKTQTYLAVFGAAALMAVSAFAQGMGDGDMRGTNMMGTNTTCITNQPGGDMGRTNMMGTNGMSMTNYLRYTNSMQYSNRFCFTNEGRGWYTNMSRFMSNSAPRVWTNRNMVIPGVRQRNGGVRPGTSTTPPEVQAIVSDFQAQREAFVAQQQALAQQLAGATESERQQLRDQMHDAMQTFRQQQAQFREQMHDQVDRLREQLRDHNRLLNTVSDGPTTGSGSSAGSRGRGPRGR